VTDPDGELVGLTEGVGVRLPVGESERLNDGVTRAVVALGVGVPLGDSDPPLGDPPPSLGDGALVSDSLSVGVAGGASVVAGGSVGLGSPDSAGSADPVEGPINVDPPPCSADDREPVDGTVEATMRPCTGAAPTPPSAPREVGVGLGAGKGFPAESVDTDEGAPALLLTVMRGRAPGM
jgi:hypothetical protein